MSDDPTAETWRYNPSPGQWTLDRAPTRDEALLMAAECATAASDNLLPVPASMARAEAAKAWAAIAAAAPTNFKADEENATYLMCGEHHEAASQYRCTEPDGHCGVHRAMLAGQTLVMWP
jgi:hypothetical protein